MADKKKKFSSKADRVGPTFDAESWHKLRNDPFMPADVIQGTFGFMKAAGQLDVATFGGNPKSPQRKLRRTMLADADQGEVGEFLTADFQNDLVEYVDGAADVIVVTLGALFEAVDGRLEVAEAILLEVARSNLSKFDGDKVLKNNDGKVLKGPNYSPPRIRAILEFFEVPIPPVSDDASFVSYPDSPTVSPGAVDSTGAPAIPEALRQAPGERLPSITDRQMTESEFGQSMIGSAPKPGQKVNEDDDHGVDRNGNCSACEL